MHRTDAEGNVAGLFSPGDPFIPLPATLLTYEWCNAVQEELVNVIQTQGGVTLNKADNGQLWAALVARFGRLGEANTWSGNQSFGGAVAVTGSTTLAGPLTANGTATVNNTLAVTELATFTKGTTIPSTEDYKYSTARQHVAVFPATSFIADPSVPSATGPHMFSYDGETWWRCGTTAATLNAVLRLPEGAVITRLTMLSAPGSDTGTITWAVRRIAYTAQGAAVTWNDVIPSGLVSRPHASVAGRGRLVQNIFGTDLATGENATAPADGYFHAFATVPAAASMVNGPLFGGIRVVYTISAVRPTV